MEGERVVQFNNFCINDNYYLLCFLEILVYVKGIVIVEKNSFLYGILGIYVSYQQFSISYCIFVLFIYR